jgi:superfamily II DNA or RNA helicase
MNDKILQITIASHFFKITRISPRAKQVVESFARKYIQKGLVRLPNGRYINEGVKVYAAATSDREEYRFHINQLNAFKEHLAFNSVTSNLFNETILPIPESEDIELKVKPQWIPRDYQIPVIEYLTETNDNRAKLVGIQTGQGKSLSAMLAIAKIAKRVVIIIKPMYIEKWVDDINKTFEIDKEDVLVIKGSANLITLIDLAQSGLLDSKFIIISNKTFQNWISLYEKHRDGIEHFGYTTKPETFFSDLRAGVRLIDEVHMDFHLCFKIDLYTNIERTISLSATLVSNDDFVASMHEIMHPTKTRYALQKLNKYINSYNVTYTFKHPDRIRTMEYGGITYSHTAFEKSILRQHETLMNYFNLINYVIQIGFLKCIRKKKKVLIFCSTIDMCTALVKHLTRLYPQYNVKRYVAEDNYQTHLMDSDICVSTLGSSGTAVDIPDLTNVILTVAVDSIQSNIQSLGRLRQLGENDRTEFHFLTCLDVPKHIEYSIRKKDMLSRYAKSFSEVFSRFNL